MKQEGEKNGAKDIIFGIAIVLLALVLILGLLYGNKGLRTLQTNQNDFQQSVTVKQLTLQDTVERNQVRVESLLEELQKSQQSANEQADAIEKKQLELTNALEAAIMEGSTMINSIELKQGQQQEALEALQAEMETANAKTGEIAQGEVKLQNNFEAVKAESQVNTSNVSELQKRLFELLGRLEEVQKALSESSQKIATAESKQKQLQSAIGFEQSKTGNAGTLEERLSLLQSTVGKTQEQVLELAERLAEIGKIIRPADGEWVIKATEGNFLEVLSTEPAGPAVLKPGESFVVRYRYETVSSNGIRIWVNPYTQGQATSGRNVSGSRAYSNKAGEAGGFFSLSRPGIVDEVRIKMVDSVTQEILQIISYKIDARWANVETVNLGK